MSVRAGETSRLEPGAAILYVEYIGTAPWNQPLVESPEVRGVGTTLLAVALRLAVELGFEGRVGLHSKDDVQGFYRKQGFEEVSLELTEDGTYMYFERKRRVPLELT